MVSGLDLAGIGWIIGGGENAHNKGRPCDADWMRAVRDLCVAHDVPFFLKQWGSWRNNPTPLTRNSTRRPKAAQRSTDGCGANFHGLQAG